MYTATGVSEISYLFIWMMRGTNRAMYKDLFRDAEAICIA
jgi:hypothetical protein